MLAILVRLAPKILLVSPLAIAGVILADAGSDTSGTIIDTVLKSGPLGFTLGLILLDKLDTTGERNLLRTQLAESQARERALYASIKDDLAPTLLENSHLVSENTKVFGEVIKPLLERVARALENQR